MRSSRALVVLLDHRTFPSSAVKLLLLLLHKRIHHVDGRACGEKVASSGIGKGI